MTQQMTVNKVSTVDLSLMIVKIAISDISLTLILNYFILFLKKKMTSIFHTGLSKDFSLLLNDDDDSNVIIRAGENQNMKEFKAHSVILRARSPYFKTAFST